MLFLLLLQGPGIEPCQLAFKVDTLTTDPLGTIFVLVLKFPELIKLLLVKKASTAICGQSHFHVDALFNILSN